MRNKKLMVLFAIGFSVIFSIFYYFLFTLTMQGTSNESRSLYMNQVGLYEKMDHVTASIAKIKKEGLQGYTLKQGDKTAVVCSVYTQEAKTKKEGETLKKLHESYVMKKVTVENADIIKLIDQKQYKDALERMGK